MKPASEYEVEFLRKRVDALELDLAHLGRLENAATEAMPNLGDAFRGAFIAQKLRDELIIRDWKYDRLVAERRETTTFDSTRRQYADFEEALEAFMERQIEGVNRTIFGGNDA